MDTTSLGDELQLYKKKLEQLQKNLFDTQVENSTLHSQSTSLLSQINHLQNTQTLLEASKKKFEEEEKVRKAEKEELLRDQVRQKPLFFHIFRNIRTNYYLKTIINNSICVYHLLKAFF